MVLKGALMVKRQTSRWHCCRSKSEIANRHQHADTRFNEFGSLYDLKFDLLQNHRIIFYIRIIAHSIWVFGDKVSPYALMRDMFYNRIYMFHSKKTRHVHIDHIQLLNGFMVISSWKKITTYIWHLQILYVFYSIDIRIIPISSLINMTQLPKAVVYDGHILSSLMEKNASNASVIYPDKCLIVLK